MAVGVDVHDAGSVRLTWIRKARAVIAALGSAMSSAAPGARGVPGIHLDIGDRAPDFELPASDGQTYRLSALLGTAPVVLAWFPKAFTPGCTAECRSIGVRKRELDQHHAVVFAACCDDVETTRAFARETGIGVPILADHDKRVARAYGVLGPIGLPKRWTLYIGADGRILSVDRDVHADHGTAIAAALERVGVPRQP
jgi:thioredoxin-dependent peroxiredoxin